MKLTLVVLLVLSAVVVLTLLVLPQNVCAQEARNQGFEPEDVITAEKPTPAKIAFGVGMLLAGILAVKYL